MERGKGSDGALAVSYDYPYGEWRGQAQYQAMIKGASEPNAHAVLNQTGMPKRAEIDAKSFAKTVESKPIAVIPFDSKLFSTAANNGQMIAEVAKGHRTTETFQDLANRLAGRGEIRKPNRSLIAPLLKTLKGESVRRVSPTHRKVS